MRLETHVALFNNMAVFSQNQGEGQLTEVGQSCDGAVLVVQVLRDDPFAGL